MGKRKPPRYLEREALLVGKVARLKQLDECLENTCRLLLEGWSRLYEPRRSLRRQHLQHCLVDHHGGSGGGETLERRTLDAARELNLAFYD